MPGGGWLRSTWCDTSHGSTAGIEPDREPVEGAGRRPCWPTRGAPAGARPASLATRAGRPKHDQQGDWHAAAEPAMSAAPPILERRSSIDEYLLCVVPLCRGHDRACRRGPSGPTVLELDIQDSLADPRVCWHTPVCSLHTLGLAGRIGSSWQRYGHTDPSGGR
jgi:hypothetical protein